MQDTKESEGKSPAQNDERCADDDDKEPQLSDGEYYYDDAHGYEDFDPDAADEDDENVSKGKFVHSSIAWPA
jgi:hypothetical protein